MYSGLSRMVAKIVSTIRGTIPHSSGSSIIPYIVWVLPDAVYPYANIVPLNPCSTESTTGFPANSYTSNYVVFCGKILSSVKLCFLLWSEWFCEVKTLTWFSSGNSIQIPTFKSSSLSFYGRNLQQTYQITPFNIESLPLRLTLSNSLEKI